MILKQYLYCALFIFPLSLSAEMKTITLSEAIEKGLSNNYYIKAEENSVNSKLHLIDSAKYGDYPSIIFDYKYTVMDKEKKLKMSMGGIPMDIVQVERNYSNLNLGINYILYAGGAIEANKNIAKSIFNSSKHSLEELKNSIKLKIQESYINILELKASREVIITQINRLKSHSNDIEALYNEGMAAKIDILQTSVAIKDAEKKLAEIDQNIKIAKYNLMVTLGEEPDDNFDVSEPKKNNDINLNEKELANLAIENRSIIKKMEKDLNTIKNTLEIEKSSYKPIVSLYGGYNYNDSNDAIHPKDGFLLQAGVSFKLDWGKPFSNIKSKKEEIYSYENLIREKKLEVKLSALKAFSDYQIAMQQYKVSLSQVEESEEFYRVMKLKYQNGLISNTDLLSSELTMTNSNMQLRKSFYDILRKLYKLEYEIGQEVM